MYSARRHPGSLTRIWLVWALLVAISVAAWTDSRHTPTTAVILVVLVLTAAKIALVMAVYMELDRAPIWLRAITAGWLILVTAALATMLCAPAFVTENTGLYGDHNEHSSGAVEVLLQR